MSRSGPRALTARYVAALSTIAVLSLAGQVIVQAILDTQEGDSRTINLAGRQRMLSQQLVKDALVLASQPDRDRGDEVVRALTHQLDEWIRVQEGLRFGDRERGLSGDNSAAVRAAFLELEASFQAMRQALEDLIRGRGPTRAAIDRLLAHEGVFLSGMDEIVSLYEHESSERVHTLQRVEFGLMFLVVITLLLEGLFVFRPAVGRIRRTLLRLHRSESEKAEILSAIPDALLRVDRDGIIRAAYVHPDEDEDEDEDKAELVGAPLSAIVDTRDTAVWRAHLARTIEDMRASRFEYQRAVGDQEPRQMEARLVPCRGDEALIILRDISERRRLERELLVVAEREQTRIGMDLHDGLCQHLAGLAIMTRTMANQIASGKVTDARDMKETLESISRLMQDGLGMARQIARGLFPEVLRDQGLAAALEQVCATVETLHQEIRCACELDIESVPIEPDVAAQLFRIAQEAIGNAIRHGGARHVRLCARFEDGALHLEIADDGVGLPEGTTPERSEGIGLRSMSTRARTIGATLEFTAREPHGTTVTCRVPIEAPRPDEPDEPDEIT